MTIIFDRIPVIDPVREKLADIQSAGEKAAELTSQLLTFSRSCRTTKV